MNQANVFGNNASGAHDLKPFDIDSDEKHGTQLASLLIGDSYGLAKDVIDFLLPLKLIEKTSPHDKLQKSAWLDDSTKTLASYQAANQQERKAGKKNNAYIYQGIKTAINAKADIISISVGNTSIKACDPLVGHIISKALKQNILVVMASGNNNIPINYAETGLLGKEGKSLLPACWGHYYAGALSVGAASNAMTNSEYNKVTKSNYGKGVDLYAPAENIKVLGGQAAGTSIATTIVSSLASYVIAVHKKKGWSVRPWLIEKILTSKEATEPMPGELAGVVSFKKTADLLKIWDADPGAVASTDVVLKGAQGTLSASLTGLKFYQAKSEEVTGIIKTSLYSKQDYYFEGELVENYVLGTLDSGSSKNITSASNLQWKFYKKEGTDFKDCFTAATTCAMSPFGGTGSGTWALATDDSKGEYKITVQLTDAPGNAISGTSSETFFQVVPTDKAYATIEMTAFKSLDANNKPIVLQGAYVYDTTAGKVHEIDLCDLEKQASWFMTQNADIKLWGYAEKSISSGTESIKISDITSQATWSLTAKRPSGETYKPTGFEQFGKATHYILHPHKLKGETEYTLAALFVGKRRAVKFKLKNCYDKIFTGSPKIYPIIELKSTVQDSFQTRNRTPDDKTDDKIIDNFVIADKTLFQELFTSKEPAHQYPQISFKNIADFNESMRTLKVRYCQKEADLTKLIKNPQMFCGKGYKEPGDQERNGDRFYCKTLRHNKTATSASYFTVAKDYYGHELTDPLRCGFKQEVMKSSYSLYRPSSVEEDVFTCQDENQFGSAISGSVSTGTYCLKIDVDIFNKDYKKVSDRTAGEDTSQYVYSFKAKIHIDSSKIRKLAWNISSAAAGDGQAYNAFKGKNLNPFYSTEGEVFGTPIGDGCKTGALDKDNCACRAGHWFDQSIPSSLCEKIREIRYQATMPFNFNLDIQLLLKNDLSLTTADEKYKGGLLLLVGTNKSIELKNEYRIYKLGSWSAWKDFTFSSDDNKFFNLPQNDCFDSGSSSPSDSCIMQIRLTQSNPSSATLASYKWHVDATEFDKKLYFSVKIIRGDALPSSLTTAFNKSQIKIDKKLIAAAPKKYPSEADWKMTSTETAETASPCQIADSNWIACTNSPCSTSIASTEYKRCTSCLKNTINHNVELCVEDKHQLYNLFSFLNNSRNSSSRPESRPFRADVGKNNKLIIKLSPSGAVNKFDFAGGLNGSEIECQHRVSIQDKLICQEDGGSQPSWTEFNEVDNKTNFMQNGFELDTRVSVTGDVTFKISIDGNYQTLENFIVNNHAANVGLTTAYDQDISFLKGNNNKNIDVKNLRIKAAKLMAYQNGSFLESKSTTGENLLLAASKVQACQNSSLLGRGYKQYIREDVSLETLSFHDCHGIAAAVAREGLSSFAGDFLINAYSAATIELLAIGNKNAGLLAKPLSMEEMKEAVLHENIHEQATDATKKNLIDKMIEGKVPLLLYSSFYGKITNSDPTGMSIGSSLGGLVGVQKGGIIAHNLYCGTLDLKHTSLKYLSTGAVALAPENPVFGSLVGQSHFMGSNSYISAIFQNKSIVYSDFGNLQVGSAKFGPANEKFQFSTNSTSSDCTSF